MLGKFAFVFLVLPIAFFGGEAQAANCPSGTVPNTLSNATLADAVPVMQNFTTLLTCANSYLAPLAGPSFSGNVGIGTVSTDADLNVTSPGGGQTVLRLVSDNSPYAIVINDTLYGTGDSKGFVMWQDSGGDARFRTGNTNNVLTLTANNSVGVGGATNPASTFDVNGNVSIGAYAGTNSAPSNGLIVSGSVGVGVTSPAQKLDVNGTIRQTGGVNCQLSSNSSGDIICVSDANLKQNVAPYRNGLSVVHSIDPVTFQYRGETYTHVGFVAQNVQAVLPEATPRQSSGYLGLDTTAILAASVNAIKDLQSANGRQAAEIATLKARLDQTDRRLAALEAHLEIRMATAGGVAARSLAGPADK
jgi:hypothetical protein